jgi:hypothetical protein
MIAATRPSLMEAKHYIFLVGLVITVPLGARIASRVGWFRDACVFALVFGTTRFDLQAINFVSRAWYRGTSRGIEICWLDFLWMIVLASEPRPAPPARRAPWPVCLPAMLLFFGYNVLSVCGSTPQIFGVFELSKMLRAILVFVTIARFVKSDRDLRVIVWALGSAVIYEWGAAVYGRIFLGHSRAMGTFAHPNSLSMYNLMVVPLLLAVSLSDTDERLKKVCAAGALLGTTAVLFTVSRNGLVTLGVLLMLVGVTCGSFKITAKKVAAALLATALVGAVLFKTSGDFEKRFTEGGSEFGGKVYEGRGTYLLLAQFIVENQPLGCGLNNWSYWVSNRYGVMVEQHFIPYPDPDTPPPEKKLIKDAHVDAAQAAPAHSLYAITLGETGWPGVVLFALVWLTWAVTTGSFLFKRTSALRSRFGLGVFFALLGALSQSFSEWEFRQTPLLFMLHILLGAAAAAHPARPGARSARPAGRA